MASHDPNEESQNYFRVVNLLIEVGTSVVKELFLKHATSPGTALAQHLLNNKAKIIGKKNLSKTQKDKLFPPSGGVADINTFDVTLLTFLLRETCTLTYDETKAVEKLRDCRNEVIHATQATVSSSFQTWWSKLSSVVIDIAKLGGNVFEKDIRGKISKISTITIDQDFMKSSVDILRSWLEHDECFTASQQSVSTELREFRIGLQNVEKRQMKMGEKIDLIYERQEKRNDAFDVDEIYTEHEDQMETDLNQIVSITEGTTKKFRTDAKGKRTASDVLHNKAPREGEDKIVREITRRSEERIDTQECTIRVDRSKMQKCIDETRLLIQNENKKAGMYQKTNTYRAASQIIDKKHRILIMGLPGAGKTRTALALLEKVCEQDGFLPLQLTKAKDWYDLVDTREKLCLLVDDFAGKYAVKQQDLLDWHSKVQVIQAAIEKGNLKLIVTMRTTSALDHYLSSETDPFSELFCPDVILNLSKDHKLSFREKGDMLRYALQKCNMNLKETEIDNICNLNEVIGFPLACTRIKTMRSKNVIDVFRRPTQCLRDDIENFHKESYKINYVVLVMVLIYGGRFRFTLEGNFKPGDPKLKDLFDIFLGRTPPVDEVRESANQLCDIYLQYIDGFHIFRHDTIHEAVFQSFGKTYPEMALQHCHLELLSKLCMADKGGKDEYAWGSFVVSTDQQKQIQLRFTQALESKDSTLFQWIADAKIWESFEFRQMFFEADSKTITLSSTDKSKRSLLVHASSEGNGRLVGKILQVIDENGVKNEEYIQQQLDSALQAACSSKHPHITEKLLRAIHNVSDDVMIAAAESGSVPIMESLVRKNGNIFCEKMVELGKNLLHFALIEGNFEMVKYIVEKSKGQLTVPDHHNRSLLYLACIGGNVDIVKYLEATNNADISQKGPYGQNALHVACLCGNKAVVEHFCEPSRDPLRSKTDKRGAVLLRGKTDKGRNMLHLAASGGDLSILKYLLELPNTDFDIESEDNYGETVLVQAVKRGADFMVRYLLEEHPSLIKWKGYRGDNLLHQTAYYGKMTMFHLFNEKGIDVRSRTDRDRGTVLHKACEGGEKQMVKYLAEHYPDLLEETCVNNYTVLHAAACGGNVDIFEYLLSNDLDIRCKNTIACNVFHVACRGGHYEMVKYLAGKYPDMLPEVDRNGGSVVHWAAYGGNLEILNMLLDKVNMDPKSKTLYGRTILQIACESQKIEMVNYLITKKCPNLLEETDINGATALHWAAFGGDIKIVSSLVVHHKLDPSVRTKTGLTIWHAACGSQTKAVLAYLVEHQIGIHSSDQFLKSDTNGQTGLLSHTNSLISVNVNYRPIHSIAFHGSVPVLRYAIENGMDPSVRTSDQRNLLHIASINGKYEMVRFIAEKYPKMVNAITSSGYSAIHSAVQGGHEKVYDFLRKEHNLKPEDKTSAGNTILHLAASRGRRLMVRRIIHDFPEMKTTVNNEQLNALQLAVTGGRNLYSQISPILQHENDDCNFKYFFFTFEESCLDVAKILIEKMDFDPNVKTGSGENLLHLACRFDRTEVKEYLFSTYPYMAEERNSHGKKPLEESRSDIQYQTTSAKSNGNNQHKTTVTVGEGGDSTVQTNEEAIATPPPLKIRKV